MCCMFSAHAKERSVWGREEILACSCPTFERKFSHNKHKTHNAYQQRQQKALNYVEILALAERSLCIFHSIRRFVFDVSSFICVYHIILAPHFTHFCFCFCFLRIKINFNRFSKTFISVLANESTNIDIRRPGHNIIF